MLKAQTDRITAFKSIILNDSISPDQVIAQLASSKNWGTQPISMLEWDQLKNILQTQKEKKTSARDEYFICYVDCKKYLQSKQIGKAIYCANAFYKKFKEAKNDEQLINIYNLFITIYEESNMIDDALKYARLLYELNCKNKSLQDRMNLSNGMVWKLFLYGRNKNSQALIQEAQALGEERFTYFETSAHKVKDIISICILSHPCACSRFVPSHT